MNDLIDRQAAIEALDKIESEVADGYGYQYEKWRKYFCGLPSAQPEQQWIPVSERLPEKPYGCFVTVWDTNPATFDEFENILPYFVGWDGKQWNDADGEQCPFEVIAWMPLPEPYQAERREE